jgi:hypothetical protein
MAAAVVTLGVSQIFYELVLKNRDYFPEEAWFHLWLIVWVQLIPFLALLGADTLVVRWCGTVPPDAGRARRWGAAWGLQGWRALLYTLLGLSVLRQFQVYYPAPFIYLMERLPLLPILIPVVALLFLVCLRSRQAVHRYVAVLGLLAAVLTGSFVHRSGLLGSAWRTRFSDGETLRATSGGPPIFVILFDELSYDIMMKDGKIDEESFPHFAELARESAWFTDAVTNHKLTTDAVPCLLSGRLQPRPEDPILFDYIPPGYDVLIRESYPECYSWIRRHARPTHTFQVLGNSDRVLQKPLEIPPFLWGVFKETPFSRSPFAPAPATRLLPPLMWVTRDFDHAHLTEITGFLDGVRAAECRGRLTYWHSPLPHWPFVFDRDGKMHDRPGVSFSSAPGWAAKKKPEGYDPRAVLENYKEQARFADTVLGRFVSRLKQEGLYADSVLVVTSDHGLRTWGEMEPPGYPDVIGSMTARIPLLIRSPRVKVGPLAAEYQHMDFVPTVLDALGFPYPEDGFQGVSACRQARPTRLRVLMDDRGRRFVHDPSDGLWRRREGK